MKHLKEGDLIPSFSTTNENGDTVSNDTLKGSKFILFFYPRDNTPGCTAEACSLRDHHTTFTTNGYKIYGISPDCELKHQKFIEKYGFPFSLLSDPDKKIIKDFGCWGPKKFMGRVYDGLHRTTFVIDENGVIEHIIEKVKTKIHAEQLMKLMNIKP